MVDVVGQVIAGDHEPGEGPGDIAELPGLGNPQQAVAFDPDLTVEVGHDRVGRTVGIGRTGRDAGQGRETEGTQG